jgi:hypothetical protein
MFGGALKIPEGIKPVECPVCHSAVFVFMSRAGLAAILDLDGTAHECHVDLDEVDTLSYCRALRANGTAYDIQLLWRAQTEG